MKKELKQNQYLIIGAIVILVIVVIYGVYNFLSAKSSSGAYLLEQPKILSPVSGNLGDTVKLETFQAEFDQPVYNLKASDLTVNGISAKNVVGSGSGPYIFYGFPSPDKRDVEIMLSSGNIKNERGRAFEGSSWTMRFFKYNEDDDGDGVLNVVEIEKKTDPTKKDTDGDGMDDSYELNNGCLNPNLNDAKVDSDNDGINNLQEYQGKTSACI